MASRSSKSNSNVSPQGKLAIIGALFGLPILFIVLSSGMSVLMDVAPNIVFIFLIVMCDVYAAHICSLMYNFYEQDMPKWAYIPCFGECALMTQKYVRLALVFYVLALVFFGVSVLPYGVLKVFGQALLQSLPFYCMMIALVWFIIVQIVKGIGLSIIFTDLEGRWQEQVHTKLGVISKYRPLLFIPFVRMIGLYALAKPLETLVTFNRNTIRDGQEAVFEEDEYEDEDEE